MCDDIMESAILNSSAGGVQDALDMGIGNGTGLSSSPFSNLTTTVDVTDIGSNGSFEDHEALLLVHLTSAASGYHIVTGALLIICAVIAIIGNSIVIAVIVTVRRYGPDTVTHILILNLATTHLLLSLLCTPLEAAFYLADGRWLMGEVACRIVGYLKSVFVAAAVITLSNIAVDRYYSVVYPLERKITTVKRHMMVCYTWVHAVVICLPYIISRNLTADSEGRPLCDFQWSLTQSKVYLICYSTLTIFLPLIVTSLAYYLVWQAFRKSRRKVNVACALRNPKARRGLPFASKTEVRLLKSLLLMVFCFVLLWTPYLTYLFLNIFTDRKLSEYFILTSVWICRVQPVLDPLIYGYLNNHFKRCFFEMFYKFTAVTCCKLPEVAVTTNDRISRNSQQRMSSEFKNAYHHPNQPIQTISTITKLDGHTQYRMRNEQYVPMNAFKRYSKVQGPTTSKVFVQSQSNSDEHTKNVKTKLRLESTSKFNSERNTAWGRTGANEEADIMEEKQVRGPTVKIGISSVPSWAFSSNKAVRCKPDQHPSVVIQPAQEEPLRIDYFDRFIRKSEYSSDNLDLERVRPFRHTWENGAGPSSSHRLPPGRSLRSPLAVKRLPPINTEISYREKSLFCDNKQEVKDGDPCTSGTRPSDSTKRSELNGASTGLKRQRKKRKNFLLNRVKRKSVTQEGKTTSYLM